MPIVPTEIDLPLSRRILLACARAGVLLLAHAHVGVVVFGMMAFIESVLHYQGPGLDALMFEGLSIGMLLRLAEAVLAAVFTVWAMVGVVRAVRSSFERIVIDNDD